LIAFGFALRSPGWRIVYLSGDTPPDSVADAARSSDAAVVVISAVNARRFTPRGKSSRRSRATPSLLRRRASKAAVTAEALTPAGGSIGEAERLTQLVPA
jgi:hypothetical protein